MLDQVAQGANMDVVRGNRTWVLFDLFRRLADHGGKIAHRFDGIDGLIVASEIGALPRRLSC